VPPRGMDPVENSLKPPRTCTVSGRRWTPTTSIGPGRRNQCQSMVAACAPLRPPGWRCRVGETKRRWRGGVSTRGCADELRRQRQRHSAAPSAVQQRQRCVTGGPQELVTRHRSEIRAAHGRNCNPRGPRPISATLAYVELQHCTFPSSVRVAAADVLGRGEQ
jgi:hypothetical protein